MPPIDPLTYLALTCTVYAGALEINRRFHNHPLVNPVLLSAGVLIVFLWF